jgi:hypothetical protein
LLVTKITPDFYDEKHRILSKFPVHPQRRELKRFDGFTYPAGKGVRTYFLGLPNLFHVAFPPLRDDRRKANLYWLCAGSIFGTRYGGGSSRHRTLPPKRSVAKAGELQSQDPKGAAVPPWRDCKSLAIPPWAGASFDLLHH